jgi:hypothetical protein
MVIKYNFDDEIIEYRYDVVTYRKYLNFIREIKFDNELFLFGSFLNVLYKKKDISSDLDLFYIGEYENTKSIIELGQKYGIAIDIFYLPNYTSIDILDNRGKTIINKPIEDLIVYRDYNCKEVDGDSMYMSYIKEDNGYKFTFKNSLLHRLKDIENNNLGLVKINPIKIT